MEGRRVAKLVEESLDRFFGGAAWRGELEGESLLLDAVVGPGGVTILSITFVADGVRQVAPPRPFDALRCARALRMAIDPGQEL
ncbi:MAG: hypothetical protein FJZ01_13685 [Candidatus Sericytochromatia bacterium]|nr:hypothetical protein [Candidatus Tanganyikabacteria bacterium]